MGEKGWEGRSGGRLQPGGKINTLITFKKKNKIEEKRKQKQAADFLELESMVVIGLGSGGQSGSYCFFKEYLLIRLEKKVSIVP